MRCFVCSKETEDDGGMLGPACEMFAGTGKLLIFMCFDCIKCVGLQNEDGGEEEILPPRIESAYASIDMN